MKRCFAAVALPAIVLQLACSRRVTVVNIDRWWTIDFAQNACRSMKAGTIACNEEITVSRAQKFLTAIDGAMKQASACRGIRLNDKNAKKYWLLRVDFAPYSDTEQPWTLTNMSGPEAAIGKGDPAGIANGVCVTASGAGASGEAAEQRRSRERRHHAPLGLDVTAYLAERLIGFPTG